MMSEMLNCCIFLNILYTRGNCATRILRNKINMNSLELRICMLIISAHITPCLEIQLCDSQLCIPNQKLPFIMFWIVFPFFILGYFIFWPWKALSLKLVCNLNSYLSSCNFQWFSFLLSGIFLILICMTWMGM